MKLKTKILTTLSSIAVIGTIVPATVSCGCSKKDYIFNYGDQVNCRDKKDDNYHKIKDVQKAAKIRAAKAEHRIDITQTDLNEVNNTWTTEQGVKLFFYDLIASAVVTTNEEINCKNWKVENNKVSFNWNGHDYQDAEKMEYRFVDKTIWLFLISTDEQQLQYRSYTYYDWLSGE